MDVRPICVLKDAEVRYGRAPAALGPIYLEVFPGEILGLRGANGAGKSTALKVLAGVLRPDAGACVRDSALAGATSYVPQEVALYEDLSGEENLRFWGMAWGLPRKAAAARSRWLLEKLELEEKARAPVYAYSGGMQRRLNLAAALMRIPKLLLLDEPTVGADGRSAELILSMVEHLKGQGCAVVMTTHQAGELERLSDRLITLEKGKLIAEERRP